MFSIQTRSDVPIYRQLVEQVRRYAASGQLSPGERLPSVRQLAEQLAVNPMTVSKAYGELEAAGVLERRRGIGMVLRAAGEGGGELLRPAVEEVVRQARQLGLDAREVTVMFEEVWRAAADRPGSEEQ